MGACLIGMRQHVDMNVNAYARLNKLKHCSRTLFLFFLFFLLRTTISQDTCFSFSGSLIRQSYTTVLTDLFLLSCFGHSQTLYIANLHPNHPSFSSIPVKNTFSRSSSVIFAEHITYQTQSRDFTSRSFRHHHDVEPFAV